ncbi:hypothetical protein NUU61_001716 [Penicillium alfredii]|uniref:Uncharacterized protein n=1 Tax=Penicillium alfredii TaxID=1506179 RepID=A0A9W9KFA8_9EURO|nr:uncharacterized protein NUU61_001716 [Penicillium alfredii]KAJ5104369.1 hypothetical protein NUU61_001716 [Penicillium alfredii]
MTFPGSNALALSTCSEYTTRFGPLRCTSRLRTPDQWQAEPVPSISHFGLSASSHSEACSVVTQFSRLMNSFESKFFVWRFVPSTSRLCVKGYVTVSQPCTHYCSVGGMRHSDDPPKHAFFKPMLRNSGELYAGSCVMWSSMITRSLPVVKPSSTAGNISSTRRHPGILDSPQKI